MFISNTTFPGATYNKCLGWLIWAANTSGSRVESAVALKIPQMACVQRLWFNWCRAVNQWHSSYSFSLLTVWITVASFTGCLTSSGNLSSVVRGGWEVQGQDWFSFGKTYFLAHRWFLLTISFMVERMRNLSSSFDIGALIPFMETHTHDLTTS